MCQRRLRPDDSIYSCENSHLLCQDCELQLKLQNGIYAFKCPLCRVTYRRCKQAFVMAYLMVEYENKNIECHNDPWPITGLWKALIEHRGYCFFQTVQCPGGLTKICDWKGPLNEVADHIKSAQCSRLVLDHQVRSEEKADKINFNGCLNNRTGISLFQERLNLALKPVVLLTGSLFKSFPFLQVERSCHGRWIFSLWSLLGSNVLNDCWANISVRTMDGKIFSSKLKILSLLSTTKTVGMQTGNVMILFDEQIKTQSDSKQVKVFDFKIGLHTCRKFRQDLNDGVDPHPEFFSTAAANPCENCVLINMSKAPKEVVTDVATGDSTVMTAEHSRAPSLLIENSEGVSMINSVPQSPAELGDDLNTELNDAVEIMESLFAPSSPVTRTISLPTNDWVSRDRPPIDILAVEEGEVEGSEEEEDYNLADDVQNSIEE